MTNETIFKELEKIEDKHNFRCRVRAYQHGHSLMTIWVANQTTKNRFHIIFQSVRYFSGPFEWIGIDLTLGSKVECCDILMRAKLLDKEKCLEHTNPKLYIFDNIDIPVKIIASDVYIRRE